MARRALQDSSFVAAPVSPVRGASAGQTRERKSKYGVLLGQRDMDRWEDLCVKARHRVGRRVTKSEILRAMLALAADDVALTEQLIDTLPAEALTEE